MIFKKLRIQNFGLFCGTHEFDLEPRVKYRYTRPIILFGGKNGSGKTTFLEAVLLCLYGRSSLGNRVSKEKYHTYLSDRIHRPRGGGGAVLNDASIQLVFSYTHFGNHHTYSVERSWRRTNSRVEEQIRVEQDGRELSVFETDHAQDFLKDLIPLGVSQLFFFDGEKIQRLAEEEQDGTALGDSLKAMLSLDIVEKLQSDLRIYMMRQKKQGQAKEVEKRIREFEDVQKTLEETRSAHIQDRAQNQSRIDYLQAKVEEVENILSAEGGTFAKKRDEFKEQAATLRAEIEQMENRIREECMELFPFAIVPELCKQLEAQLYVENESQKWTTAQELVKESLKNVEQRMKENILQPLKLPPKDQKAISSQIKTLLLDAIRPEKSEQAVILHNLSSSDSHQMLEWLTYGIPLSRKTVMKTIHKLEKIWQELRDVERYLARVPEDDILAPHIQYLNELNQKIGALQATADRQDKEIRQFNFQLEDVCRQYKKYMDELSIQEDLFDRIQMIDDVQDVLDEFLTALAQAKVAQLKHAVAQCFGRLCRKGDIIRCIEINPVTFTVTLYNREGRAIPKTQLSAGEKQIYAVSMLWALAQTSGRPLPIIIDTPLGRLDSDHRRHLVESYFPKASHQVIILSTDTEIDKEYFKALGSSISHVYHLEYDSDNESTVASEGYFWKRHRETSA